MFVHDAVFKFLVEHIFYHFPSHLAVYLHGKQADAFAAQVVVGTRIFADVGTGRAKVRFPMSRQEIF